MLTALSIIVAVMGWTSRIPEYLSNPLTMVNGFLLWPIVVFSLEFMWHFARNQPAPTPTPPLKKAHPTRTHPPDKRIDEFNMRRHSAPYSSRPR